MQKGVVRCLYEVLGVELFCSDGDELKRAYRRAALQWHPDKHAGATAEEMEKVRERFLEVQEAYRVLRLFALFWALAFSLRSQQKLFSFFLLLLRSCCSQHTGGEGVV